MYGSVVEAIYQHSLHIPEKTAIISYQNKVTYAELWQLIGKFAQTLKEEEINQGDYVVLKATHSLDFAVALFAINLRGAIVIPVEKNLPPEGIVELAELVSAKAIISEENEIYAAYQHFSHQKIVDICENKQALVCESFPEAKECSELLFTTGTTGKSKGVELLNQSIMTVLDNIIVESGMLDDNVGFVPMPLNHVFGLRRFQANLVKGATVIIQEDLLPIKAFFKTLKTYPVTSISLVPSAISYIFAISKDYLGSFKNQIRYIESSSAPLSPRDKEMLHKILPNTRLFNFYGCTESTAACVLEYSKYTGKDYCVGKPCINSDVKLLDSEGKIISKESRNEGRIIMGGNASMGGYWHEPELTADTLIDGYVYTNDLGYWDEEGFLYVLGRMDDVVNIGGNKVSPDDVEEVVLHMEEVRDCGCIGIPDQVAGNELKLYLVSDEPIEKLEPLVRSYLQESLEAYKIPKYIEKIESIPRTYNGKIQRKKLRELNVLN